MRREWDELQEGEVQEDIPDDAAPTEFSEDEEEGWEESEEFAGEDSPDDPEELPPVFSQEKPTRPQWRGDSAAELPRRPLGWNGKPKQRGLVKPDEVRQAFSPHERLLILDTWQRSGLAAGDFAPLVGISKHTLYLFKIEPRRRPQRTPSPDEKSNSIAPFASGAGILPTVADMAMPALGQHDGPEVQSAPLEDHSPERVHSSTENSIASGQN